MSIKITFKFFGAILNANVIYVPDELPTIQIAIEKVLEEGTILVAPGVYSKTIDYVWMSETIFKFNEDEYYGKASDISAFEFISNIA